MAPDDAPDERGFLSRWSRRKALVRQGEAPPEPPRPVAAPAPAPRRPTPTPAATEAAAPPAPAGNTVTPGPAANPSAPPPPTLDDLARIDALDARADFSRFVQPDVAPALKNAALKKLFSDPHFNVMDGLDIYIDDYGRADPLPPGMLEQMAGSDFLGLRTPEPPPPAVPHPVAATVDAPDPAAATAAAAAPGEAAPPADPAVTAPAPDPTAPAPDAAPPVALVTGPTTNAAAAPPSAPPPPNDPARPCRP